MTELNELERIRLEKAQSLRAAGMDPYPAGSNRTHSTAEAIEAFEGQGEQAEPAAVVVAGRIKSIRDMGKSLFAHVEDASGRLQLYLKADEVGPDLLELVKEYFDIGDFIEAAGAMFRTRTGEVTLQVGSIRMLAKSISPLPTPKVEVLDDEEVVHDAFSDPEARYRQRYVDLAVNPETRQVFRTRAAILQALRQFLDERGFLEVETPVLQPIYGGAAAEPFVTHHNQLHQDLYLRISFELYLKRLLVGMYEAVYEIGRDFRNEGVSYKHNPEFTQLEFYLAYADYREIMDLSQQLVAFTAEQVTGSTEIVYQGHSIDLAPPWDRIELAEAIHELAGIDLAQHPQAESLRMLLTEREIETDPAASRGKLIDQVIGRFVEPELIQPTILYKYPRDISPLARKLPDDPGTVERFEGFVAGMELFNAFTELNDPLDQRARFEEMGRTHAAGDQERHPLDEDYLRAMRYGMPPNGGFGMGVDRLTMLLTDKPNIREVILFPHLRQRQDPG